MSENNADSIQGAIIHSSARVDDDKIPVDVHRMNYPDGSEAVQVFAAESTNDIFAGEPLCDLSVNLIEYGIIPEPGSFYFPTSQAGTIPTSVIMYLTQKKKISVASQGVRYGYNNQCFAQLVTWL